MIFKNMKVEILLVILKIKYEFLAIFFPGKREIRIEYSFSEFVFSKMTPKRKINTKRNYCSLWYI